jgi:hypothetical protein
MGSSKALSLAGAGIIVIHEGFRQSGGVTPSLGLQPRHTCRTAFISVGTVLAGPAAIIESRCHQKPLRKTPNSGWRSLGLWEEAAAFGGWRGSRDDHLADRTPWAVYVWLGEPSPRSQSRDEWYQDDGGGGLTAPANRSEPGGRRAPAPSACGLQPLDRRRGEIERICSCASLVFLVGATHHDLEHIVGQQTLQRLSLIPRQRV